ncbi:hypothetical protein BC939DRAFT_226564 [Gamsiella multidivaricata]|uniref:uncharacterized protein n=1 Tax=Gamsiella multidivaricata TaxID=101098 RepID=UPI00221FE907|nr:uncharacterized protein BC939DRAFT_226564 [Gamsiella multidivaricata]KAI7831313.1 hypothetical protein BC939DRAFT_226564 [Gamsiella multidivaricata]
MPFCCGKCRARFVCPFGSTRRSFCKHVGESQHKAALSSSSFSSSPSISSHSSDFDPVRSSFDPRLTSIFLAHFLDSCILPRHKDLGRSLSIHILLFRFISRVHLARAATRFNTHSCQRKRLFSDKDYWHSLRSAACLEDCPRPATRLSHINQAAVDHPIRALEDLSGIHLKKGRTISWIF